MKNEETIKQKPKSEERPDLDEKLEHFLILHNDDIHTFDFVIESLVEICKHHIEQAEQCTFIAHYKGKCDIKRGSLEELKPYKNGLTDRGLSITIK